MKTRLLLLVIAGAMLLSGCVSTSGYGSSHSIGVGSSYGRPSAVYGYQGGYPRGYGSGSHGYGSYGYGSYGYRGDDDYDYGHGSRYRYDNYNGHGYPYSVPRQRVIHPGNGSYGYPYPRSGYRGHGFNRPPGLPHPGSGRPPWGNITPPPPGTHATSPPVQPPDTFTPDAGTRKDNVGRGLRRYKGGEMPESVITAED